MPRWRAPLPGLARTLGPSRLPAASFMCSQPSPPSPPRTTFNPCRCWSAALCGPTCDEQGAPKQCEVSFCRSHPSPGHSAHHQMLPLVALRSAGEQSHGPPVPAGCAPGRGALPSPLPSAAHPSWRLRGEGATGQTRDAQPGGGRVWARPRLSGGPGAFSLGVQRRGPALNVSHQAPWNVSPSSQAPGGVTLEGLSQSTSTPLALRQQTGWEAQAQGRHCSPGCLFLWFVAV